MDTKKIQIEPRKCCRPMKFLTKVFIIWFVVSICGRFELKCFYLALDHKKYGKRFCSSSNAKVFKIKQLKSENKQSQKKLIEKIVTSA